MPLVVDHPSQWPFCGYNEIQKPRRKNILIDYEKFMKLTGAGHYDQAKRDGRMNIWVTGMTMMINGQGALLSAVKRLLIM